MENPFTKLALKSKKIKVKALGGEEVTIQELNVAQSNEFQKRLVKGLKEDGSAELDYNQMIDIRAEKVVMSLIEPKITLDELRNLPAKVGNEVINEIADAIEGLEEELKK